MNDKEREPRSDMEVTTQTDDTATNYCPGEGCERPLPTCDECGCRLSASDIQLDLKVCFWCDHEAWTLKGGDRG